MNETVRIAMWSGPRNISTALMRSFEARGDTAVVDEPFYACFLAATGLDHPLGPRIVESQPTRPDDVIRGLERPLDEHCRIQYQKQMAHHIVFELDEQWLERVVHAFLIRDPAEMVASYAQKRETVSASDLGVAVQRQLYERISRLDRQPAPVIDARDVLRDPPGMLEALCRRLGIGYTGSMCRWPPGIRETDGIWASHWYDAVAASTGFAPYVEREVRLDADQRTVVDECLEDYRYLHERRLRPV